MNRSLLSSLFLSFCTFALCARAQIEVSAHIAQNIGLQSVAAELRPIERTVSALGRVEAEPGSLVAITSRVAGRVTELAVHDGQRVGIGNFLVAVESRVAAQTPPRLRFTSPIAGRVLEAEIPLGGAVEPADTLLTLVDLSEVDVVGEIHSRDLANVRIGQRVRIRSAAYPGEVFEGELKTIAANVDPQTGTRRVFVHTPNPEEKLLLGMRVQLSIVVEEQARTIVVPREAVRGEAGEFFVFRELPSEGENSDVTASHERHYERTSVVLGLRNDRYVEIIDGVLPGDRVVTRGSYQLEYLEAARGEGAAAFDDGHGHSHGPGGHTH